MLSDRALTGRRADSVVAVVSFDDTPWPSRLSPLLSALPSPLTTEATRAPGCCSTGSRATPARRAWSLFHPRCRSGKARYQNDAPLPGVAEGAVGTDQGTPDKEARNVEEH
jgi:hypothetical protein